MKFFLTDTKSWRWLTLFIMLCALFTGCSKKADSAAGAKSFDTAPAEIKNAWNKAVKADEANDYVTAVTTYKQLLEQETNLSPAQVDAIRNALGQVNQRLVNAAMAGDAAARKALTALSPMKPRK